MSGDGKEVDLVELKRLAQEANPRPRASARWMDSEPPVGWVEGLRIGADGEMAMNDVDFISATNPGAVLALIEKVEFKEGELVAARTKALESMQALNVRAESAEADNAALRDALQEVHDRVHLSRGRAIRLAELLAQPHPGGALLARITCLEAALRKHARRVPCPACGGIGSRTCATCDNGEKEHLDPEVMAALEGKS